MLRESFPNSKFWPPATETQIAAVEATLGVRLPEQLRSVFFECDGFREPRTNAKYLLSLTDYDFVGSLVTTTQFFWTEWKEYYPKLNLVPFVFFGSSGYVSWGISLREPGQIIAYHHHMEGEYEIVGSNILEVYRAEYASQDDADQKS